MIETPTIHYLIAALSGAFGAGVVWGSMKASMNAAIKSVTKELANHQYEINRIKDRQARLRGEDDGNQLFVSPVKCDERRGACHADVDKTSVELAKKALLNAERIKRLENYARWTLQDKGLKIHEINRILDTSSVD